ncbi:hypothetical protein HDU86_001519, partial [Geranomyces michiganensis]
ESSNGSGKARALALEKSSVQSAPVTTAHEAQRGKSSQRLKAQARSANREPCKMSLLKPTFIQAPRSIRNDFNKVSQRVHRTSVLALFRRLLKGPRNRDGKGHIYIYQHKTEKSSAVSRNYWKIGCTGVAVETRIKQWGKQCGYNPVLADRFPVKYNKLCESLIHMELKARKRWLGNIPCRCQKGTRKGHCEWFFGTLSDMSEAVLFWTKYVDETF